MRLFDETHRDYDGTKPFSEPQFSYLNRSARSDAGRVRHVLESWFSKYSADDQADLRERFRDKNDVNHRSAFFELFLHELLIRLGCCVTIHPIVRGTTSHPEFLVTSAKGDHFYMEATLATGQSEEEAARQARVNEVKDALDQIDSPEFFIGVVLHGCPDTPLPVSRIRSDLENWLLALVPEEIIELANSRGLRALPHWWHRHEGFEIEVFPIPKPPNLKGKATDGTIGMLIHQPRMGAMGACLRNVIKSKAGRYGQLNLPYIIAVNAISWEGPVERHTGTLALWMLFLAKNI